MVETKKRPPAAMTYVYRDGRRYSGDNALQVVSAIRSGNAFTAGETVKAYMRRAAARYARFSEITVRADSPENFLADLEASGEVKRLKQSASSRRNTRKASGTR
jgi:hypothetical protein